MKEIVVGIDFSESSVKAFHYAVNVANECSCNLKLIYVCKKRDKHKRLVKDDRGIELNANESFKQLIDMNCQNLKGEVTFKMLHGKIYEEISNQAKYTDAEMIITGAHGMSGFEELWVGNNAMKIIMHSEKPVLSVKKNYKFNKPLIEKIVIPVDSTQQTLQKVPFTLKIAKLFHAQVNVLSLFSSKTKEIEEKVEANTKIAHDMIVSSGVRYISEKKHCSNIARATIDYATKRNADLISMMTEQEFSSNNVFLGTYAQQTINLSPMPILSFKSNIPYKSNIGLE